MSNATQQLKAQQRRQKFADLLREMFQLNQPELDFGLYRIMHARKDDINRFIEQDLPRLTQEAFSQYASQDQAQLEAELEEHIKSAKGLGMDPDAIPKVQELKQKLQGGFDLAREEGEVYDALVTFFNRYYNEGDFLSRRVYKDGTYAIPYQGEEVVLHWANKDQYYIKSSETLRDYSFRLNPDAGPGEDPMRVHFKLVDAEAGAKDNNKESGDSRRVFVLDVENPFELITGEETEYGDQHTELQCRFVFRPATESDWTEAEKKKATAAAQKKPPTQDPLRAIAEERLLGADSDLPEPWKNALAKPYRKADGNQADYSMLAGQLNNYTKKNAFDYFIHKDLGGFLTRELDYFVKNEILNWDDIASLKKDTTRISPLLSKIDVIRSLAQTIIKFLAQLEDFQKRLWLKKKFVVGVNYCASLGKLSSESEILKEILGSERQLSEWREIYSVDISDLRNVYNDQGGEAVAQHPKYKNMIVDTKNFDSDFKERFISAFDNISEELNGVLVKAENSQALRLLKSEYSSKVKLIYIDPPYNTGGDGFLYKDTFQHSSWLSMMGDRVELSSSFLSNDGVFVSNIDGNEASRFDLLLSDIFGESNKVGTLVWKGATDNNPTRIATEHEYLVSYAKSKDDLEPHWSTSSNETKQWIMSEFESIKSKSESLKQLEDAFHNFMRSNKNQIGDLYRYRNVDEEGPFVARRNMENPGKRGYDYDVIHPVTGKPCTKPYWGWRFSENKMNSFLSEGRIIFGDSEQKIPELKVYLRDVRFPLRSVFNLDARKGSNDLDKLFNARDVFKNPKPKDLVSKILPYMTSDNSFVLDFFTGSGTTAHAIIDQNREAESNIRYILVDQGDHFDEVLVPRIKKSVYSSTWKSGAPVDNESGTPQFFKYLALESYEDTLGNLAFATPSEASSLFGSNDKELSTAWHSYLINYMLDVETRGSQSLLNVNSFSDPKGYRLNVRSHGGDETKPVNVDLLETFNYLLGLEVEHIAASIHFEAELNQGEYGHWQAKVKRSENGKWWFRTVYGTNRAGQQVLVVWRNLPSVIDGEADGIQKDNAVLDAVLIEKLSIRLTESQDDEIDVLYVNGDHNISIPRSRKGEPMEQARIQLIEEAFHRLMFADTEAVH